mmetsp:Transcript_72089/g.182263  ORF Transcript_72089/g.182263 Transcript_72089/m.182263 type:complete len:230 (-) Transcript_72089:62-751(-)
MFATSAIAPSLWCEQGQKTRQPEGRLRGRSHITLRSSLQIRKAAWQEVSISHCQGEVRPVCGQHLVPNSDVQIVTTTKRCLTLALAEEGHLGIGKAQRGIQGDLLKLCQVQWEAFFACTLGTLNQHATNKDQHGENVPTCPLEDVARPWPTWGGGTNEERQAPTSEPAVRVQQLLSGPICKCEQVVVRSLVQQGGQPLQHHIQIQSQHIDRPRGRLQHLKCQQAVRLLC